MAAEIVMVVENEDTGAGMFRTVEMRRRKPADAAADNDEIVIFAGRRGLRRLRPEIAVAQTVRGFEAPGWLPRMPVNAGG